MDVSELSGKVTVHRMYVAFRFAPPGTAHTPYTELLRRDIMMTALPLRQWAGKHQMIGPKETSTGWYLR